MNIMDWKDKVAEGMRLIGEGCKGNPSWPGCNECPFDAFCDAINKEFWNPELFHDMYETFIEYEED